MKHVSILVPAGEAILSSIVGAYKVFNSVNKSLEREGRPPFYKIELAGISNQTDLYNGAFSVRPTMTIDKIEKTDLIIITTINGDIQKEIENNNRFIPWIQSQYANGAEIASLCIGSFLLAATGLLDGKWATTHWIGADAFRMMFPKVKLLPEKIITDESGIYTSGGAYSFLNLLLYLVEKYNGREMAISMSKLLEVNIDRYNQNEFAIFRGQKEHADSPIKKAQQYIENNFGEKISVDDLAMMFALSRRNFIRRFKKATNNTPLEYIQRVKVEAAKKSLETSSNNITEVMIDVGYSDTKAFRSVFKKYTGCSPAEYRTKYNRYISMERMSVS